MYVPPPHTVKERIDYSKEILLKLYDYKIILNPFFGQNNLWMLYLAIL